MYCRSLLLIAPSILENLKVTSHFTRGLFWKLNARSVSWIFSFKHRYWVLRHSSKKRKRKKKIDYKFIKYQSQYSSFFFFLNVDNKFIQEKFGNNKMFYSQPVY